MAGTAVIVKREWPVFTHSQAGAPLVWEEQLYLNIRDIITDLEVLRAHEAALHVLLDADSTSTTYVGDAANTAIDAAGDLIASNVTTRELGD